MEKIQLTGLLPREISAFIPKGKEAYRSMQIFRWIHEKGVQSFDEMTNLSKEFREETKNLFIIGTMKLVKTRRSLDETTDKYLWELADGNNIESVIIRDEDRVTACISSQVGCKMGCRFCRTGEMKFIRSLTSGEIVDQLINMRRILKEKGENITNIVFMGMGEPLDNLENVLRTLAIINMETGLSISQHKNTVSTCGIVPGIIRLAGEYKRLRLAISLNATYDELRNDIMPINRRYPLKELLAAALEFTRITRRRITFEYILMDGINDSPQDAKRLLSIAHKIPSKINLIGYNEYEGSPFKRSSDRKIEKFQKILFDGNVTAILRKSKGTDILAACGQLAARIS
ncbi:MAG: 23S rRNA (adenine(2503)-C(2))-methyltransferase RlmN [Candidatus Latescibacterota bacterium]